MYANLTDDGRTHRVYADDGLPWRNQRTTFYGFVITLTVRLAHRNASEKKTSTEKNKKNQHERLGEKREK